MFIPNFSVAQTPSAPGVLKFTDTSTGTDASISARRIYIVTYNNTFLVPSGVTTNYTLWNLPTTTKLVDVLTEDVSATVKIDWVDSFGNILYTKSVNYCFSEFNKQFFYYLIQLQAHNYNVIQDNYYWGNAGIYWTNIIGAINAVVIGDDIGASQACLNRANMMKANQEKYF